MTTLYRELVRLLMDAGCFFVRTGKGDHEIWFSPVTNQTIIVDAGIRSRHTANAILRSAGLPKAF